jgi:hypothetical protein
MLKCTHHTLASKQRRQTSRSHQAFFSSNEHATEFKNRSTFRGLQCIRAAEKFAPIARIFLCTHTLSQSRSYLAFVTDMRCFAFAHSWKPKVHLLAGWQTLAKTRRNKLERSHAAEIFIEKCLFFLLFF